MPAGDRTGPAGSGPMTGRRAGLCSGSSVPGYANPAGVRRYFGYGRGAGGGGRGRRNCFYATGYPGMQGYTYPQREITAETEIRMLQEQAELMQKEVASVNERIKELELLNSAQKEK